MIPRREPPFPMNKTARSIRSRPTRPEHVSSECEGDRAGQVRRWLPVTASPMPLLTGQEDPAMPQLGAALRNQETETEIDLAEQLAFAGRVPAVGV